MGKAHRSSNGQIILHPLKPEHVEGWAARVTDHTSQAPVRPPSWAAIA